MEGKWKSRDTEGLQRVVLYPTPGQSPKAEPITGLYLLGQKNQSESQDSC